MHRKIQRMTDLIVLVSLTGSCIIYTDIYSPNLLEVCEEGSGNVKLLKEDFSETET